MRPVKVFNGKQYRLDTSYTNKSTAEALARNYRKHGHPARVTSSKETRYNITDKKKTITMYTVWVHN